MKVLQSWSGGKDSTLSAYLHLERGDEVTLVCSIPYFNKDIPLIGNDMLQFIYDKKYYFERLGAKVPIVRLTIIPIAIISFIISIISL